MDTATGDGRVTALRVRVDAGPQSCPSAGSWF